MIFSPAAYAGVIVVNSKNMILSSRIVDFASRKCAICTVVPLIFNKNVKIHAVSQVSYPQESFTPIPKCRCHSNFVAVYVITNVSRAYGPDRRYQDKVVDEYQVLQYQLSTRSWKRSVLHHQRPNTNKLHSIDSNYVGLRETRSVT